MAEKLVLVADFFKELWATCPGLGICTIGAQDCKNSLS